MHHELVTNSNLIHQRVDSKVEFREHTVDHKGITSHTHIMKPKTVGDRTVMNTYTHQQYRFIFPYCWKYEKR